MSEVSVFELLLVGAWPRRVTRERTWGGVAGDAGTEQGGRSRHVFIESSVMGATPAFSSGIWRRVWKLEGRAVVVAPHRRLGTRLPLQPGAAEADGAVGPYTPRAAGSLSEKCHLNHGVTPRPGSDHTVTREPRLFNLPCFDKLGFLGCLVKNS